MHTALVCDRDIRTRESLQGEIQEYPPAAVTVTSKGFTVIGEADLMYAGRPPAYHPECIYGLASMGSIG